MKTAKDRQQQDYPVAFAPLVPACNQHGIGKTTAFKLDSEGLLETFLIGSKKYVKLESLHSLPDRLANRTSAQGRESL